MTRQAVRSVTTSLYRAIILECERRRMALGLPMEKFCEYAGLPDRYYGKAVCVDTPSGRQPQWPTLQIIIDALFPNGFDVEIRPKPGTVIDAGNLKARLLQLQANHNPLAQRDLMRELSGKAAEGRKRIPARKRSAIARRAAKARWRTPKVVEITVVPADTSGGCAPR
jgi:hypothetical protein